MPPNAPSRPSFAASRLSADRAVGLGLIAFGLLVLVESRVLPMGTWRQPGPAYFPVVLAIALMSFGALLAIFSRNGARLGELGWEEARQAILIVLGAGIAIYLLTRLGYVITIAALLFYLLAVVARRPWFISLPVALGLAAGTFALFDFGLRVPLPRSPFGFV
jgi:putative tricarboxylic transport membrane protein